MKNLIIIFIFFLSFDFCIAGTIDPSVPDNAYLEYGEKFPFVAKVTGDYNNFASAVILNKNTFITSAHVAKKINKIVLYKDNYAFEFKIKEIIIHEKYKKESYDYDIAIGKISESFNLDSYPELYRKNDELGKKVSICGYGDTGSFSSGKKISDKKRRAGTNIIFERSNYILYCSAADQNKTELEFLICHGDSGGGLFIDNKLAGINCFIDTKDGIYNSNYADNSGYVRISQSLEWIQNLLY